MKSLQTLPENYGKILTVNLQKDKKRALLINGIAIAIGVAAVLPMHFRIPITTLFDMTDGLAAYALRFGVLLGGLLGYLILHELVHGIAMKLVGTKKVRYGFTGLYAFAGSDDYYDRSSYIFIALAPIVVWGVVLAVLSAFVPAGWFWVVWLIQVTNLSGAAGDLYVTFRFSRLPADILVRDSGVSMEVYSGVGGE